MEEDKEIIPIKKFNLNKNNPNEIAAFLKSYKFKPSIPIIQVADLLFEDENKMLCIFGDRAADICIIGCTHEIFSEIRRLSENYKCNNYYLTFMNAHEFVEQQLKLMLNYDGDQKEQYNFVRKMILTNYSNE